METTTKKSSYLSLAGLVFGGLFTFFGLMIVFATSIDIGNPYVLPDDMLGQSYNGTNAFIGALIFFVISLFVFVISCRKIAKEK